MDTTSLAWSTAALALVLAAIVVAGRFAKLTRFAHRDGRLPRRLAVVEALSLDPRRRLLLVQCDGRCVLLLTGPQDQVVGWLADPPA